MNVFLKITISTFFVLIASACDSTSEHEHVLVSGPLNVNANQRTIVKSPISLQTPNYFNSVCLLPANPTELQAAPDFGFVNQGGKKFNPGVYARNKAGVEDRFPIVGNLMAQDGVWQCYDAEGISDNLHSPYVEIVIFSPEPLNLRAIKWHSSDK